jgi:DNA polymerase III epsilon subunit-like protein
LVPGDLDPTVSKHHITKLKHAYLKLRYLVDCGCIFVGHGLKQDFKMINIVVPPAQIIDTVELFHFKRQRKLGLRFLAGYLLGLDIQQETHDSIEDARTAVRLYEKYLELVSEGNFQAKLLEIYRHGGAVYKFNPVDPYRLKAPGFSWFSKFAFKFNLHRYTTGNNTDTPGRRASSSSSSSSSNRDSRVSGDTDTSAAEARWDR